MSARVLDLTELALRASAAVQPRFPGAVASNVEQLIGGTSSLTYAADLTAPSGSRRIVIKAAPPGLEPVRNRDVLRQARVLELLGEIGTVAVPEVLGQDPGAPVDVPPLFVMSFVPGEGYEPATAPVRSQASTADIEARGYGAAQMAARLHAVPVDDPRLGGEKLTDLAAEAARWARALASVDDDLKFDSEAVGERLAARLPEPLAPSVLHGDWRLGNMQCNGPSIDAVIDWEIWSLGDRRLDLGWFLLMADPEHPTRARDDSGLPSTVELLAAYEEASGTTVVDFGWFEALVRYKQAAATALIVKNNRKIPQPGVDIARMQPLIPVLLDWAKAKLG